jgi:AcrR family transcriptional regulator
MPRPITNPDRSVQTPPAIPASLRAFNRHDKRQRIREAAREVFTTRGFQDATMREIAGRARVALGTLFNYANDKRDLTFLVFNDDLADAADEGIAASREVRSLVDRVMALWEPNYQYFGRWPALSRIVLGNMFFYRHGTEGRKLHKTATRLLARLEELVQAAQRDGELTRSAPSGRLTFLLFSVFSQAVRFWLEEDNPSAQSGIADLRDLLEVQLRGLRPMPGEGDISSVSKAAVSGELKPRPRARRVSKA